MKKFHPAILLLLSISASAQQVWMKVATEGSAVTTTATVRYGAPQNAPATAGYKPCATVGGCWAQLSVSGPFAVGNDFFKSDPISGTVKELDILETASPQTVTVDGKTITVPGTAPPVPITTPTGNSINFSTTISVNGKPYAGSCTVQLVAQ